MIKLYTIDKRMCIFSNVVTNGANVVVPVEPSNAVPEASASVSATAAPDTIATETLPTEENSTEENNIGITIQATTDNPEGTQPQLTEYDALNRQTKVKIGNDVYKYGYNEDGLRTWKEVNGEKTYFVWDNDQIVLELDENEAVNKKYIRGLTLLYSEDDNAFTDDKVFYNYNAHGDVVQLLDVNGNVTKYYQYDSFGNEINEDENDENPWRYCGEYFDKETGTIYLRARYYAPGYGRFTTRDTYTGEQKDPLSLNLYTYCENEPVLHVDTSGHRKEKTSSFQKKEMKRLCKNGYKYKPSQWNDGTANKNNRKTETCSLCGEKTYMSNKIQYTTNCYAYAFNFKKHPVGEQMFRPYHPEFLSPCSWGFQPGDIGSTVSEEKLYQQSLINLTGIENDMNALNIDFEEVTPSNKKKYISWVNKAYIVALVIDYEEGDYHWYRLDKNGRWSHKRGPERVTQTPNNGRTLPMDCYKKHTYTDFVGYYYVKKNNIYA